MGYPCWRHHKTKGSILLHTPAEEAERAPAAEGWRDCPAKAKAVPDPVMVPQVGSATIPSYVDAEDKPRRGRR